MINSGSDNIDIHIMEIKANGLNIMKRSDDEIGKIRTNANAIRKGFKINIKYVLQLTQLVCIVTWHKARFN